MTTQLTTSNFQGSPTGSEVVGVSPPSNFPDEATLSRLASEFFAALPNSGSGHSSGLTNIAYEKSLNPEYPEHIPNYPDYPERRAIASAPVVGGANLPRPPIEPNFPQAVHSAPNVPLVEPSRPSTNDASPFYFLNDFTTPSSSSSEFDAANFATAQSFQLPHGDALKSLLQQDSQASTQAKNNASSGFYFLDLPQHNAGYGNYQPSQPHFVANAAQPLDIQAIRRDFPILQERVNGRPLVWFDNAATTQKPQSVIDRIAYFYQHENSNIHRAAHELAARATDAYEHARNVVARFIGAKSSKEIIFVRGTTEGINLIAKTWGEQNIGEGDEIIVSHLEHHANIVPWFQLTKKIGAKLRVIPVDDTGQIILEELPKLINERTKLISITQVSNALGTVTPVAEVIKIAHAKGVRVLVDGAQSVSHMPTDIQAIDADFFVFSGHKVFGPTGIGAVYAKPEILETMPVWEGGGNMIQDVTFEQVIYQPAPNKFEAGTGNIADAVGLGAALEYVERLGIHNIARYEHDLLEYGQHALSKVSGLRPIGTARNKASVMSFTLEGYSTEQVGKALNQHGIAVRSGHHCAQPILRRFGVEQTVRPSLAFYNTTEEIDLLVSVLHQLSRNKRSS